MILHIIKPDKFIPPFIDFVDEHFERDEHKFVFISNEKYEYGLTPEHNVEFLHTDDEIYLVLLEYMKEAKKIILHGLWRNEINILLYFNQEMLKKSYWIMWGGDFYFPEKHSQIKKEVIRRMGYLVTYIPGDIEYVRDEYQAKGEQLECLMYPSNIYKNYTLPCKETKHLTILVGNSADPSNNHSEVLKKLSVFKKDNIKVIAPISYGNQEYAKQVEQEGRYLLGDKFEPLTELIPFEEYLKLLGEVDIAIFNHNRQQAMGNTINLLGMGKKVYIRKDVPQWALFKGMGIEIYDVATVTDDIFFNSKVINKNNVNKVQKYFSQENLMIQLRALFN